MNVDILTLPLDPPHGPLPFGDKTGDECRINWTERQCLREEERQRRSTGGGEREQCWSNCIAFIMLPKYFWARSRVTCNNLRECQEPTPCMSKCQAHRQLRKTSKARQEPIGRTLKRCLRNPSWMSSAWRIATVKSWSKVPVRSRIFLPFC
jgi:hypothetical protein